MPSMSYHTLPETASPELYFTGEGQGRAGTSNYLQYLAAMEDALNKVEHATGSGDIGHFSYGVNATPFDQNSGRAATFQMSAISKSNMDPPNGSTFGRSL